MTPNAQWQRSHGVLIQEGQGIHDDWRKRKQASYILNGWLSISFDIETLYLEGVFTTSRDVLCYHVWILVYKQIITIGMGTSQSH